MLNCGFVEPCSASASSSKKIVIFLFFRYNIFAVFVKLQHHHKMNIIIGAPVVFLFLFSGNLSDPSVNILSVDVSPTQFPRTTESVRATITLDARSPSNAVGATLRFDQNVLEARALFIDDSIIDIWAGNPTFNNDTGTIHFNGGFIDEGGYTGRGKILSVEFRAKAPGIARITIEEPKILANDGIGTNRAVKTSSPAARFFVFDNTHPSVDQNDDGRLSLADAQTVYFATFRAYDSRRDLNRDGKVSWADVSLLLSLINE